MNFWKIVILFIATIDCKNHATSTIPHFLYSFSRLCHISVNLDCVINKDWRSIFLRNFRFNTYLPKKIWCKKSLPWKSIFWLKKKRMPKAKMKSFLFTICLEVYSFETVSYLNFDNSDEFQEGQRDHRSKCIWVKIYRSKCLKVKISIGSNVYRYKCLKFQMYTGPTV